jgi:segregation and condensation protein A
VNSQTLLFILDRFEGPLELLLHLIQEDEIDICSVEIKSLTSQFLQRWGSVEVEAKSDNLVVAATLLLIKSQKLLPQQVPSSEISEGDPRFEVLQSLIAYSQLKEVAKELARREEVQSTYFPRAISPPRKERGSGLERVEIENLKNLLLQLLQREEPQRLIVEEEWQISQKIEWLRHILKQNKRVSFPLFFSEKMGRKELIVVFLALLEMMKNQEARVVTEEELLYITR